MFVQSGLIKLPSVSPRLPLPWYLRAGLGFLTKTRCHVAFVKCTTEKGRPVPDIVVSVLDPLSWHNMLLINCSHEDAPGVVGGAFGAVGGVNIALAESITLDEGLTHAMTLTCELTEEQNLKKVSAQIRKELALRGFKEISIRQFHKEQNVTWADIGIVTRGWICQTKWRDEFHERYGKVAEENNIDLT